MKIVFSAETFKRMMKVCSSAVIKKDDGRRMLQYICIDVGYDGTFTACGVNGHELAEYKGACEADGDGRVFIKPVKTPKDATRVVVDGTDGTKTIVEYQMYSRVLSTDVQVVDKGEFIAYDNVIPKPEERDVLSISVDPKAMIELMSGLKDFKSVKMSFRRPLDSILITPNHYTEGEVTCVLLPMRVA